MPIMILLQINLFLSFVLPNIAFNFVYANQDGY